MRDEKGRFLKGSCGNPGGKPDQRHVRELAKKYTEDAIRTLAEIMLDDTKREAARVSAAEVLLDRGWGKPTQPLDHGGEAFSLVLHMGGKPVE